VNVCQKCGFDNAEGEPYCMHCGAELPVAKVESAPPAAEVAPPPAQPEAKPFEKQMEDLGKKIAGAGQKIGEDVQKAGGDFERMWYSTLGLLAPIIGGLIVTVVFLVFILVVGAVAVGSEHRAFWDQLKDFLETNFLLFLGLFFLSSFTNYFNKVHKRMFRWITPVMMAVGLVGWFWILAEVLFIGARTLERPGLRDLGDFVMLALPVLFLLALCIGYLVVLLQVTSQKVLESKS